jgi:tetrahydromethanopterin S-methyltransferase subunit B
MMETNPLENRIRRLEEIVESMMIVREGIQELDGFHTDLYNSMERQLKRRTMRLREDLKRKQQKSKIEAEIEVLKLRLTNYD